MKIRNGFVSNSSTSSFVVLFTHKPKTVDDLKDMMFKEWSWDDAITGGIEDIVNPLTVRQVVEKVFKDIQNTPKDRFRCDIKSALDGYIGEIDESSTITHLLRKVWDDDYSKSCDIYHQLGKKYGYEAKDRKKWKSDPLYAEYIEKEIAADNSYKEYIEERNNAVKELHQRFMGHYKYHKYEHVFEYGDRNGEYVLETGNIFRNVPHLEISNH